MESSISHAIVENSVFDVANYILEISREESEDGEFDLITPMKLQKLVYFCQGYSLALLEKPLFPEPIEAWEHGPVCPKLYHMLKVYKASPMAAIIDPEKIILGNNEKHLIRMVYDNYRQYSASGLRKITHEKGPWKEAVIHSVISHEAMAKYFYSLIDVKPFDIPPATEDEKKVFIKNLEEAEANGEVELSQFSVAMGK
jgi:uncharacterized phage-associated protein